MILVNKRDGNVAALGENGETPIERKQPVSRRRLRFIFMPLLSHSSRPIPVMCGKLVGDYHTSVSLFY